MEGFLGGFWGFSWLFVLKSFECKCEVIFFLSISLDLFGFRENLQLFSLSFVTTQASSGNKLHALNGFCNWLKNGE